MKFLLFTTFVLGMTLSACNKPANAISFTGDNGCIERITIPVTSHGSLSDSDYNLVDSLFTVNGIKDSHYRYSRTYRDSGDTYNGKYDFRSVYIIQYANELPIFIESLHYLFANGVFSQYTGKLLVETNLDTSATLELNQLRRLFLTDIETFDYKGNQFKDSCFVAEFGYFNLSALTGNATDNLIKAWHITPKLSSYPEAYYQDINGQRICYFNGIETFK